MWWLVSGLAACVGAHGPELPSGDENRPDVLLVSIDTLRADHLGAWGYSRPTTPRLDVLAARGTRFRDAWAPSPWTLPSHATLLSGTLPNRHGAIEGDRAISPDVPWLPDVFHAAGYLTIGVVATWFVSDRYGFSRGFDEFFDFDMASEKENLTRSPRAEVVLAHARDIASKQPSGKPIFMFIHLYDAHYPYDAPSPWNGKFDRPPRSGDLKYRNYAHYLRAPVAPDQMAHQMAQYDEEIAYVDDTVGRFIDEWTSVRQARIAIVSDHGEEFGERGSWGHAHTLWPEQLHVPWILAGEGVETRVTSERVGIEDVAPTLALLAGVSFETTDGKPKMQAARAEEPSGSSVSARYAETSRFRTLKMRWHEPPFDLHVDLVRGERSLCDVEADPACRTPVDDPERSLRMEQSLFDWLGDPFEAIAAGAVTSPTGGAFVTNGVFHSARTEVLPGQRFALFPPDAEFSYIGEDGTTSGPWNVSRGRIPTGPIRFDGSRVGGKDVVLEAEEKRALEALGYVQ